MLFLKSNVNFQNLKKLESVNHQFGWSAQNNWKMSVLAKTQCIVLSFIHIEKILSFTKYSQDSCYVLENFIQRHIFWGSQDRKDQENDVKIRYCLRS